MFFKYGAAIICVLINLLLFAEISHAQTRRIALVIGNADYKQVPKLANSINDAEDMAKALRGFGF